MGSHDLRILLLIDIDECANDTLNNCSPNATCTNTNGGYTCTCDTGYAGDGFSCDGMYVQADLHEHVLCLCLCLCAYILCLQTLMSVLMTH